MHEHEYVKLVLGDELWETFADGINRLGKSCDSIANWQLEADNPGFRVITDPDGGRHLYRGSEEFVDELPTYREDVKDSTFYWSGHHWWPASMTRDNLKKRPKTRKEN